MTNNEIILQIYKNYDVEKMVTKNIASSNLDDSYKDLASYIYLTLLQMNNSRLQQLYQAGKLRKFIVGIICNQRNINYSIYNKFYKYKEQSEIKDYAIEEYDDETENKLDFINNYLISKYKIQEIEGLSGEEQYNFFSIEILKLYIKKKAEGKNITYISKQLKISRNVISSAIGHAKQLIKKEYEKKCSGQS